MKLADALMLVPKLESQINDLRRKRNEVSTLSFDESQGQDSAEKHDLTVCEITDMIMKISKAVRDLKRNIAIANVTNFIDWETEDGAEKLTVAEAMTLRRQMDEGQTWLEALAKVKTSSKVVDPAGSRFNSTTGPSTWSYKEVTVATFDVPKYKKLSEQNKKASMKLNSLIQSSNWAIDIGDITLPEFAIA
jgi:hypothetical protein